ncbi:hypothetical protein [Roseovarius spongiae]|uniref:hypothetical protein n=1 Tax=Roseovarius spongiae TaxID=2320272 RepID=UPI00140C0DF3|nr:hypothetical protein [Roseovarius spongiae]
MIKLISEQADLEDAWIRRVNTRKALRLDRSWLMHCLELEKPKESVQFAQARAQWQRSVADIDT